MKQLPIYNQEKVLSVTLRYTCDLYRGINFTILTLKIDLTEVMVEYNYFEISAILHEFLYGRKKDDQHEATFFVPHQTTNLPNNYTSPRELTNFLVQVILNEWTINIEIQLNLIIQMHLGSS